MIQDKYYFAAIHERKTEFGHHYMQLHERPFPNVGPTDVLVKMEAINICTTDYQQWMGLRDHQGFPMAEGHEYCGIIVEKGSSVSDSLKIGDRIGQVYNSCGYCDACRLGFSSDCENEGGRVIDEEGFLGEKSFSNYRVVDQKYVMKISKDLPAAEAAFLEPVATVVQCARKADIRPTDTVVVIGAGTMGLVNAQVAKAFGARVIITEISEKKIERARTMEIGEVINSRTTDPVAMVKMMTEGKGADIVISAVGASVAYKQGYQFIKPLRGKLIIFPAGYPKPEMQVDPNQIHYAKSEIIGSFGADGADFVIASRLLSYGLIDVSFALEGKVFPLHEIEQAFAAAATPDTYRITVNLQDI